MSRLQDFQPVTPTSSDNLLVVQATGQGLASVGSTLGAKMDKADPTGTGSLSLNRKANTITGDCSVAIGYNCEANKAHAHAEGSETVASGEYGAHAEGRLCVASGDASHAEGRVTIAQRRAQHVFGEFNIADTGGGGTNPEANRGQFVEIVGNGQNNSSRSNARTLDWSGNEVLAGNLTVGGRITNLDISSVTLTNFNSALSEHVGTNAVLILPNVVLVTLSFTFTSSQAGWANICDFASTKQNTNTFGMVTTGLTVDGKSSVVQAYYSNNKCIIRVNGATGGVVYRGQLLIPLY